MDYIKEFTSTLEALDRSKKHFNGIFRFSNIEYVFVSTAVLPEPEHRTAI